jgi:hypothetical protein
MTIRFSVPFWCASTMAMAVAGNGSAASCTDADSWH